MFGKSEDIFVDIGVLRCCGLSGLVEGERGLTAVALLSWEAAQGE